MSSYYLSNGTKLSKSKIDSLVLKSKKEKRLNFEGYGCEHCKRSDQMFYDTSHIISVKECQEMRKSEIAYDVKNLELLCRNCHIKHESKPLKERILIYESKL